MSMCEIFVLEKINMRRQQCRSSATALDLGSEGALHRLVCPFSSGMVGSSCSVRITILCVRERDVSLNHFSFCTVVLLNF